MEKMELIKPGIYKKTVRGQNFNNTIINKFQNLQERIENLKEIKPTGKMLKEKTLRPKLRQSMLLRAFKNSEKNLISSTPYHKNTQQFFENTSSLSISPIKDNEHPVASSSSSSNSEIISCTEKNNENQDSPQQDSSLIYVRQESPTIESARSIKRRSRKDMTPNRNKRSTQEAVCSDLPHISPKQNSKCRERQIQKSSITKLPNNPEHTQLKNNFSKIPVRKHSQESLHSLNINNPKLVIDNSHRHRDVTSDIDDEPLENIHKSLRASRHLEELNDDRHQSINVSKSISQRSKDKSISVVVDPLQQESPVEDRTIFVNKTPRSRKRKGINNSNIADNVENDENGVQERSAIVDFVRSIGLSPIVLSSSAPQTPQRQIIREKSMTQSEFKSASNKREILHRTLEKIRQQSTRATQVTPVVKSQTKRPAKNRKHLRLSRANIHKVIERSAEKQTVDETVISTVSGSSGTASDLINNAYNTDYPNSEGPNIYDSLLEGNDLQLDFSDSDSLHLLSSAIAKPWRVNSDGVSNNYDSIKLNFIRSENQIRSSQICDSLSSSSSDSEDLTLRPNVSSKRFNKSKSIIQTGKRQYNKRKRKSRLENQLRKSYSTRQSGPQGKNISSESEVITDTGATTSKQISEDNKDGSSSSTDAENILISVSSSDSKLLGVKPLAEVHKKNKAQVTQKKDKKMKSKLNSQPVQEINKELYINMEYINVYSDATNRQDKTTNEVEHDSPISSDTGANSVSPKSIRQQKSFETSKVNSTAINLEANVLSNSNKEPKKQKPSSKHITQSSSNETIVSEVNKTNDSTLKSNLNISLKKQTTVLTKKPTKPPTNKKRNQSTKTSSTILTSDINLNEGRPQRNRKPPRHLTDIVVTENMLLLPKRKPAKRNPSVRTRSYHNRTNLKQSKNEVKPVEQDISAAKKTKKRNNAMHSKDNEPLNNGNSSTIAEDLANHCDATTITNSNGDTNFIKPTVQAKKNRKKKSAKQSKASSNKVNSNTVDLDANNHVEIITNISRLNDFEIEIPTNMNNSETQSSTNSQNVAESTVQVKNNKKKKKSARHFKAIAKDSIIIPVNDNSHIETTLNNSERNDLEIEMPTNNPETQSSSGSWRNFTEPTVQGTQIDSGFITMKKNVSNPKSALESNSKYSGVKNGYITKNDKKRNMAKSATDKISKAMESLPLSSIQSDTTVSSQQNVTRRSRRLTGAELVKDDFITYMSNNSLYSVKYLNKLPLDSEYKIFESLHVKESVKDPTSNCSSGYIKLNPGHHKRPNIATKYSLFYNIISGSASIQLHNKTGTASQGDFFYVPLGIEYSIRNINKDLPLILYYVKVKGN